jgi:hypothetical protein
MNGGAAADARAAAGGGGGGGGGGVAMVAAACCSTGAVMALQSPGCGNTLVAAAARCEEEHHGCSGAQGGAIAACCPGAGASCRAQGTLAFALQLVVGDNWTAVQRASATHATPFTMCDQPKQPSWNEPDNKCARGDATAGSVKQMAGVSIVNCGTNHDTLSSLLVSSLMSSAAQGIGCSGD